MLEQTDTSIPKKILFLTTSLSSGGAQMMLYKLLSRMNQKQFAPVVISLIDRGVFGDRIEALGVPVHPIGMQPGKPTPDTIWRVISTTRKLKPDLVQGWMYHGNLAAQLAGVLKLPVVWSIRQSLYSLDYEKPGTAAVIRLSAQLSRLPLRIIYNAKTSAKHHEAIGYLPEKTLVIPNGFDPELFKPSQEAYKKIRAELNLPEETLLIGLMGRFHPMKDHTNFLQAAALLQKSHPGVNFVLAGENVDEKNKPLNQLIQELGLVEVTHLLGDRQNMPELTAALNIACCSSYTEGFANVIGEAMSCCVPCVVTDVGDSAWIVENTGRVVPPRDANSLVKAWQELLELGAAGREVLGKAARARVIDCFSLDSVVAQYEVLYERVLTPRETRKV